jgi:hypothetical protein
LLNGRSFSVNELDVTPDGGHKRKEVIGRGIGKTLIYGEETMKRLTFCISVALAVAFVVPAFAQVGKGLSGPHYNLNIIGVPNDKTVPDMTGSNRHTIFVPLESGGDVSRQVKIYYIAGDEFRVIDGNATDDNQATIEVPSDPMGDLCYDVYAVALGKPFGNALVQADCIIDDLVGSCTDALEQNNFSVERVRGKPKRENISNVFRASGCIDMNGSLTCDTGDLEFDNVWIFNIPQLLEYFWDYDNDGLRLMQTRFYETTCGSFTTRQ